MTDQSKYLPAESHGPSFARPSHGAPTPPAPIKNTVDIGSIWRTMRRGKWIIFLVLILATGGAAIYSYLATPEYEAESIIQIKTDGSALPGDDTPVTKPTLSSEMGVLMRSADLVRQVSEEFVRQARETGRTGQFPLLQQTNIGDNAADGRAISRQVYRAMEFRAIDANDMIAMISTSSTPQEAALLANVYAAEYQIFSRSKSRAKLVAARDFLEEQLTEQKQDLDAKEYQYGQFVRQQDIITSGEDGERTVSEYFAMESERSTLENQLRIERGNLNTLPL